MTKDELIERLREALGFYAQQLHYGGEGDEYDEDPTFVYMGSKGGYPVHIENGTVAKQALALTCDDEWQDISTAPKDGSIFDTYKQCSAGEYGRLTDVWFSEKANCFIWQGIEAPRLTHWMYRPVEPGSKRLNLRIIRGDT